MKRPVVKFVGRMAYWLGIDALFYWLNRKTQRVVTFHNVLPDECLQKEDRGRICFSASEFRAAIRELKKRFEFSTEPRSLRPLR